ncbi:hypothetical protein [Pedobacter boryungensis]|uniref:PepSY-like beta-lactamase-inhibitor n=1 Tax=Pedobacter boryungensis TaxID=869962 RepID=A0ABX2DEV0_9SPHI|nr:hypothetical protein [Pedobacter boryungensis]NQX32623.1 hypothetical protein [Pedobacter boryungensis]
MKKHSKDQIEATANSIMQHFIPKDAAEQKLSFHFTIPPSSNYKVSYEKDAKGNWNFVAYEIDEGN